MEKAFDRVPRVLRKLGVEEWIVPLVQGMYANARSHVRVGVGYSEKKGLRGNAGKTKIMICGTGLDLLQSPGEFPCAVCRTGVGSNSIFCNGCKHWVHKKCSGLKPLKKDPDYRCTRCQGTARPLGWQTIEGSPGQT